MAIKLLSITVVLSQRLLDYKNLEMAYIYLLFATFTISFYMRSQHNQNLSTRVIKFESSVSAITFWASSMLLIRTKTKLLNADIEITSYLSLIGLILTIIAKRTEKHSRLLLKSCRGVKSAQKIIQILEKLSFLLKRFEANDGTAKRLLKGYIDKVQSSGYTEEASPLMLTKIWKGFGKKMKKFDQREDEALLEHISLEYLRALRKFRKNVDLHISYVAYLADFLGNDRLAYQQIYHIRQFKRLGLVQMYTLNKIKNQIDAEDGNSQRAKKRLNRGFSSDTGAMKKIQGRKRVIYRSQGNRLKIPKVLKERLTTQLYSNLEKACTEFMYLWQTIEDENPQISKIFNFSKNSYSYISLCIEYWEKNKRYFKQLLGPQEAYGRFLKQVVDLKKEGGAILKEACFNYKKRIKQDLKIENVKVLTDIEGFQVPSFRIQKNNGVSAKS